MVLQMIIGCSPLHIKNMLIFVCFNIQLSASYNRCELVCLRVKLFAGCSVKLTQIQILYSRRSDSGVDKVFPTFLPAVSPDHLRILFWVPERVSVCDGACECVSENHVECQKEYMWARVPDWPNLFDLRAKEKKKKAHCRGECSLICDTPFCH